MIQFQQVTKKYPKTNDYALQDINFKIEDGEFVFLIGPSGSGKTSIMRMLIREERPSDGKIYFDDYDITKINRQKVYKLRRLVGVVFQDYKLIGHKNVYENIAFAMEVAGQSKGKIKDTVDELLEIVGLSNRAYSFPSQLSGGEQQRVAIARAISNNPRVLIADEPTGNLDPASAWDIVQILTKINSWGTTVLMSTHGTDIVNSLNKRVIQLHGGTIVRDDNKGQYELTRHSFSNQMLQANNMQEEEKGSKSKIQVQLKTDKINANRRDRKHDGALVIPAETPVAEVTEEFVEPEPMIEEETPVVVATEVVKPKGGFSFFGLFRRTPKEPELAPEPKTFTEKKQAQEARPTAKKPVEKEQPAPALVIKSEVTVEKIKEEIKEITKDEAKAEDIAVEAEKIAIERLDIGEQLLESLTKAGYKYISDVIEAGPEKLASDKVIDPIEVIELAQALSEFIEVEMEKPTKPKAKKAVAKTKKKSKS